MSATKQPKERTKYDEKENIEAAETGKD